MTVYSVGMLTAICITALICGIIWLSWQTYQDQRRLKQVNECIDKFFENVLDDSRWGEDVIIGGVKMRVHSPSACEGHWCCVHNPSNHPLIDCPQVWRADLGIVERICPHGIGHPDPDDVAYRMGAELTDLSVHGCDGCCKEVAW